MFRPTSADTVRDGGDDHNSYVFFNDTATTEIYTLSLHDALPISLRRAPLRARRRQKRGTGVALAGPRSEEHTSELQSRLHLVCRLLLEKNTSSTPLVFSTPNRCRGRTQSIRREPNSQQRRASRMSYFFKGRRRPRASPFSPTPPPSG